MKEQSANNFLLYEIMKYPIPLNKEYFSTIKEEKKEEKKYTFSREQENELMKEYKETIKRHKWLFCSLPFVKDIYLCNSITFNALHEDSDIDLFIITKKKALRRARLISAVFFFFLGLKRTSFSKKKKFCLTFYVDENHQNIYTISLPTTDIYLAYWIAHLVPLYHEEVPQTTIYTHNKWIQALLPNRGEDQQIFLGSEIFTGNSSLKKRGEKILGGRGGIFVEKCIKFLRLPLLIFKTKRHKEAGRGIVINNTMLKFHLDQRKKIQLLYNTRNNR